MSPACREERRALEEKYDKLYIPLYDKRADVISGKAEAPENETRERRRLPPLQRLPLGSRLVGWQFARSELTPATHD